MIGILCRNWNYIDLDAIDTLGRSIMDRDRDGRRRRLGYWKFYVISEVVVMVVVMVMVYRFSFLFC